MNYMENIQGHIEITRQQIIAQLHEEISHFEAELGRFPSNNNSDEARWGQRLYSKIIARKRQLITCLS